MRTNAIGYIALITMFILGLLCMTHAAFSAGASADSVLRTAARQNRYVFVTFYKPNDGASERMLTSVRSIQGKLSTRADFVSVDMSNQANRPVITRFGADRSPIPLTIVVAPHGAVTAGFPQVLNASADFSQVFVSHGQAAVLKVLQEGKLAVVCLQNAATRYNSQCSATANGLKADSRIGSAVVIVKINPADRSETTFLQQNNISGNSPNAQLVVFAPPGRVIGRFDGSTPQATVLAGLHTTLAGGGCSGGCCNGGCCNGHCGR